jgi:DNA-binding beta-propeller fold protein YncE
MYRQGAKSPYRSIDVAPNYPWQIALDHSERYLYVSDSGANAVTFFDYASANLAGVVPQPYGAGGGVAVSPAAPL